VPAMKQQGLTVIGWNDWFACVYFPLIPKPYFTDGHPDEIDLKEAVGFGKEMVERSRRIYQGEKRLVPEFPIDRSMQKSTTPSLCKGAMMPVKLMKYLGDSSQPSLPRSR